MKLNISRKIVLIAAIGVVASSTIILCISIILMSNLLTRATHDEMSAMQSVVVRMQQQEESRLLYNMNIFATMPEFAEAVHMKNTQKVNEVAVTLWRQLELDAVTVTDANGLVIARGHSDRTGDDISGRPTMIAALKGETSSGILFDETAVIPYSIRCDAPIIMGGAVVGVISLALDIGAEAYVDNLHKISGMDFTLYKEDISVMTSIKDKDGSRANGIKLADTQVIDKVLNKGEIAIVRDKRLGDPDMMAYWPVKNINGDIIGMWAITKPLTRQSNETQNVLMIVIICSLGAMLLVILAAGLLGNKIARPIRNVTDYAVQVAGGNLDIPLDVQSRDEVGLLVNALRTMVINLKDRIREAEDLNATVLLDIEKKRALISEVEQQRTMSDTANKAKSSFLSTMSHEMRTPLNAIIGLTELSLDAEGLNDELVERLEKVYTSGTTLLGIVNDILDISKIESGKFEINPVEYDTPSLINDSVTLNIMRIAEKPVEFKLFVDEKLPGLLYGDDLRVKQIFNNLLSNAFKYTNAGSVEWSVTFEREGDSVWLVSGVKDTGIGMRPEDLNKLFSDYSQVNTSANRKVEGTGLGLVITKRLVEMMDGTISVESTYGEGTAFYVRLRQKFVSDVPIGSEVAKRLMNSRYTVSKREAVAKLMRIDMSYANVLVVDDVTTNLDVAKGMLKPYGMRVDCALNGQEAINMIKAGNPRYTAVFMDHMMPGMDGIEATRIIREELGTEYARNIPIIALTANAIVGNEEMFLHKGFQAFISKPIDMMKLDSTLRQWVRDKSLENKFVEDNKAIRGLKDIAIRGLDICGGLARFGDDEEIYLDILHSYTRNTRPLFGTMSGYLAAEDLKDYAITIHGIKGSSYSICAQETGKAAEELEFAAKAGNLEVVKTGHILFVKNTEVFLDSIDKALANYSAK